MCQEMLQNGSPNACNWHVPRVQWAREQSNVPYVAYPGTHGFSCLHHTVLPVSIEHASCFRSTSCTPMSLPLSQRCHRYWFFLAFLSFFVDLSIHLSGQGWTSSTGGSGM